MNYKNHAEFLEPSPSGGLKLGMPRHIAFYGNPWERPMGICPGVGGTLAGPCRACQLRLCYGFGMGPSLTLQVRQRDFSVASRSTSQRPKMSVRTTMEHSLNLFNGQLNSTCYDNRWFWSTQRMHRIDQTKDNSILSFAFWHPADFAFDGSTG